jgi:Holliday junction resolvase
MPLYITEQNRKDEKRISEILEDAWLCNIFPTPDTAIFDGVVVKHFKLSALLEIKVRDKYDSKNMRYFYIDKEKVDKSMKYAAASGVPYVICVEDKNKRLMFIKNPKTEQFDTTTFTRQREGEKPDEVYMIPTHMMKDVNMFPKE